MRPLTFREIDILFKVEQEEYEKVKEQFDIYQSELNNQLSKLELPEEDYMLTCDDEILDNDKVFLSITNDKCEYYADHDEDDIKKIILKQTLLFVCRVLEIDGSIKTCGRISLGTPEEDNLIDYCFYNKNGEDVIYATKEGSEFEGPLPLYGDIEESESPLLDLGFNEEDLDMIKKHFRSIHKGEFVIDIDEVINEFQDEYDDEDIDENEEDDDGEDGGNHFLN